MTHNPTDRQRVLEPEIVQAWIDACARGEIDTATLAAKLGCELDVARDYINAALKAVIQEIVTEKRSG